MRVGGATLGILAVMAAGCAAPPQPQAASPAASVPALAAPSLAGTRWRGVVDPATDDRYAPWLEFVTEGRVSGYTGCNLLHGGWKVEAGELHVGPLVTTKRACAGPEQDIERRVLAVLNERSRATREANKLVFTGPAGERVEFVEAR
ncbi:MAG: META domain-containing protein [Usitatibacter sp.]